MPETGDQDGAERWHEVHLKMWRRLSEAAVAYTVQALRMLLLLNRAAAIAVLAFLGAMAPALADRFTTELPQLTLPILWFAFGAASAVLSAILAYFSISRRADAATQQRLLNKHPFVEDSGQSINSRKWAYRLEVAATGAAALSLVLFICGAIAIRVAINSLAS